GDIIRASASVREGRPVKLNCQYSTTYTYYALGWYQQLPGQQPLFLLYRDERGNEHKPRSVAARFSSELSTDVKSFTLSIDGAQRADSAVYFCGLGAPPCRRGGGSVLERKGDESFPQRAPGGGEGATSQGHQEVSGGGEGRGGARSQVKLAGSGPGLGQVSEPLTLTCAVSGGSVTADYWDWYRQLPRGGLDWLGEIDWYNSQWRVDYAPSLQGRITLSADSSKNQFSLRLRSLTGADTATYYSRGKVGCWGGGVGTDPWEGGARTRCAECRE
uniref:Ig-like domain-containing protein n=1 Tax=Chrysemys picta bellii TaxID=8478 RepID=A0A8C3H9N4_CHRPI